jgi:fructose-1,6-bisphosphatase I
MTPTPGVPRPIKTLQQHILEQQNNHPTAHGGFSWLLSGITLATKIIAAQVRRIGLAGDLLLGAEGSVNVQGETVQKMDRFADETLLRCLGYRGNIGILVSEENEQPVIIKNAGDKGKYLVLFDPLDGSSNLDCNIAVGTIFTVYERDVGGIDGDLLKSGDPLKAVLQPGVRQLAAGYVLYSSSTVLAYTTGQGVHMFTLDPAIGAYVLSNEYVTMPESAKTYSCNEGNHHSFPAGVRAYLDWAKTPEAGPYSARYVGSLVADFHRILMKGGVFLYPGTAKQPGGKLRLLYEGNPLAFLAEQAGGMASDGRGRILEKVPGSLHERTPLFIGSRCEVENVLRFVSR